MKLNLIQSLPEDLAKQNYELKAQLQQARQSLDDFDCRLAEAITCIAPNKPLRLSPVQAVGQLVQLAKHQHSQLKSTQHCAEVLRGEHEQLQRQQISRVKIIAERDIEIAAQKQYAQEEARRQAQRQRQLEEDIERLQQCNGKLVEQLQQLKIERIGKESGMPGQKESEELGSVQSALRSELLRAVLQRQQVENRLQLKAREVVRSQKDKEALEQYYDQKWNSEYKKVKIKLEQTYKVKIAQLEEESQLRLLAIENELREMRQEKAFYLERNQELEYRFNMDQKEREALAATVAHLRSKIDDFKVRSVENSLMFREEIRTIKVAHSEERALLCGNIAKLGGAIELLNQELIECRTEHVVVMTELKRTHQQELNSQVDRSAAEREQLVDSHRTEVKQLKSDIYQQLDNAQIVKDQAEREFQSALQQLRADHEKAIAVKDLEFNSNNRRWIDKHCELESLLSINRRKFEEELARRAEEVQILIEKQYALLREIDGLKDSIARLEEQVRQLQAITAEKNALITEKQAMITSLSRDLTHSMQQIEILLNNRKQWRSELLQVGREFTQTFEELKRTNQKQLNLYRSRIAELQEVGSRNQRNLRQVEKIHFKHEQSPYRPEIHIREAENLILHKVKDYYETKLREEGDLHKTNFKNSHAILARKLKKNRAYVNEVSSHRALEPKEKEAVASKTRYSSSAQKQYHLSLSSGKFKEGAERLRVQTMSSFK